MAKDSGALNLFGNMQKPTKDKSDKVVKENNTKTKETVASIEEKVVEKKTPEKNVDSSETKPIEKKEIPSTTKNSEVKKATKETKKLGRPKTLEEDKIRLTDYLTPEIKEKVSKYSTMFPGGISGYIEKAIKKDLEQNESTYETMIKNIMG